MTLWYISIFAINIALSIAALIGLRYAMAAFVGVHVKEELDKQDNFAFGLAIAGGVLSLLIIMSGAISGESYASITQELLNVVVFALVGIIMLKLGLLIQEHAVLRGLSLREEIRAGNLAAAMVMAVNLLATGLIIRAAVTWVEVEGIAGLVPVVIVYIISQIILALVTLLRVKVYASRHSGASWQNAIKDGNMALAIRFAGHMLGTALALGAVGNLVDSTSTLLYELAYVWLGVSVATLLVVWGLYKIIVPIVLTKVNIVEEVDNQKNIGVASIEASIFVGVAVLLLGFMG